MFMRSNIIIKIALNIEERGKPITEVKKAILNLFVNLPIVWLIEEISNLDIDNSPIPKLIPSNVNVRASVDIPFENCKPVSNQNFENLTFDFFNFKIQNNDPKIKANRHKTKDKPRIDKLHEINSLGWFPEIII